MLPIIATIFGIKIYSFGVLLVVGLFLGLYWWWKMGRDENLEETPLFDAYFLAIVGFLIGGRGIHVLMNLENFGNIYRVLGLIAFPGMSYLGGVIVASLVIGWWAYYQEWELWKVMDNWAAAVGVVWFVASLGGLLNGSLPGIAVSWGMVYPGFDQPRLPLDILQIIWSLTYFGVINWLRKNFRFFSWYRNGRTVAPEGLPSLIGVVILAVWYMVRGFLEETWRWGMIPAYTLLGVVVGLVAGLVIYWRSGRKVFGR